jgi:hypothetical protein
MAVTWAQLALPFEDSTPSARSCHATFASCPHCDGDMKPEHAHYRCVTCGWRDSCCD